MTTVSGILRHYAGGFLRHSRTPVCWQVRSVLAKLGLCRTAALGEHQYRCDQCGHECRVYNSCGDRHCPQCAGAKRSDWLASTAELLLPQVPYFQVVFTIPDKLSSLALGNRKVMFNLLFHAAWSSLKRTVAGEQQFQPAAVMALHTEVRFVEKSTIRSDGAGPDPVRKRAQRAPRTDTTDSVFEKSGSDRVANRSSVRSAVQRLRGMICQYRRSDRNTASGDAASRVRGSRQPERSTAPRACRQESGFPSGSSRREHNWQATHGTRPPLPPILFSRSPPASERKEWGEVRYGAAGSRSVVAPTGTSPTEAAFLRDETGVCA